MRVQVLSRSQAIKQSFTKDDWVISINDDWGDMAKLTGLGYRLPLVFADVGEKGEGRMEIGDAERILHFARLAKERGKNLWVHCSAGVSRSAGVALALKELEIAEWLEEHEETWAPAMGRMPRFFPNIWVTSLIERVAVAQQGAPEYEHD